MMRNFNNEYESSTFFMQCATFFMQCSLKMNSKIKVDLNTRRKLFTNLTVKFENPNINLQPLPTPFHANPVLCWTVRTSYLEQSTDRAFIPLTWALFECLHNYQMHSQVIKWDSRQPHFMHRKKTPVLDKPHWGLIQTHWGGKGKHFRLHVAKELERRKCWSLRRGRIQTCE